jgi:hypothetical protein
MDRAEAERPNVGGNQLSRGGKGCGEVKIVSLGRELRLEHCRWERLEKLLLLLRVIGRVVLSGEEVDGIAEGGRGEPHSVAHLETADRWDFEKLMVPQMQLMERFQLCPILWSHRDNPATKKDVRRSCFVLIIPSMQGQIIRCFSGHHAAQ